MIQIAFLLLGVGVIISSALDLRKRVSLMGIFGIGLGSAILIFAFLVPTLLDWYLGP
jgi:hypothetical protein